MMDLMETIQTLTEKTITDFEIYHYKEFPELIYINLYNENRDKGLQVEKILKNRLPYYITETEVYTPTMDEVNFAFSGYMFTGLIITVNEKNIIPLLEDHYLVHHNLDC